MTFRRLAATIALLASLFTSCAMHPAASTGLVHDVYFTLREDTDTARATFAAACHERLAAIPGITWFAVGTRARDLQRDVNDQGYDVSLHVCFASRAAHDAYQVHPEHVRFVEENKVSWQAVRVFDSDVRNR